jgi:hypothetical protein
VEIEVGQAVAKQEALAVNCRVCPLGKVMLMSLVSVPSISLWVMLLRVIDGLGNPIFQLSNRGLVVGKF